MKKIFHNYKLQFFVLAGCLPFIWLGLVYALPQLDMITPLQFITVSIIMFLMYRLFYRRFPFYHLWSVFFLLFYAYELHVITELFEYSGYIWTMWKKYLICIAMIFTILLGVYAVTNHFMITVFGVTVLFVLLGILNYALDQFRGKVLFFDDFFSVQTAMEVAENYHLTITPGFVWTLLLAVITFFLPILCRKVWYINRQTGKNFPYRIGALLIVAFAWFVFCGTGFLDKVPVNYWRAGFNGYVLNFVQSVKAYRIKPPENYNVDKIEELSTLYIEDNQPTESGPNIIVIMNESFADFRMVGDFETNQEVMPFLDSLDTNVVKGACYVSVRGGNTPNSEYEFLTGLSLAQYSAGAVPFQLNYVYDRFPSLVRQLKSIGYRTVAAHPCKAENWNRPTVYRNLGFDEQYFEEDFKDVKYSRKYVSDQSDYEFVMQYFEEHKADTPIFMHNVTMQNHGGYDTIPEGTEPVRIVSPEGDFARTEVYLTLLKESDSALKELISYFEGYDSPTVICFFGDHQAETDSSFIEALTGEQQAADLSLEERQKLYKVPFAIWSNYDMQEETLEDTSLNYLGTILCQKAGIPLTGYQRYLQDLQKEIPAINTYGYLDAEQNWHDNAEHTEKLTEYKDVMYNIVFDKENIVSDFYELR